MKTFLKIAEMLDHGPAWLKDAAHNVAKDAGLKTDDLELHRHSHSEKAKVNGLDPKSRCALKYVSARTQDRDDEIVIPEVIQLAPFRKYMHVLFNHNYSLPPLGSDRTIEADDFGIKALTEYADTGVGTMANVMWALVSQGHQKASSIGFVPTSFTKPGARDWDHVANQLQSNWKEFDKGRAEKSISRIITGGVLLEHSDVTVPCNVDAEMVQVIKALHVEDKVLKQFGWEMKEGILVTKAAAEPVPCVCDECGFIKDAVPGAKCPECKTGAMKAKGKEKVIEVREKEPKLAPVEKENPRIPGGSFTECVLIMGKKGHDEESAKKICGALQVESGEKLYDVIAGEVVNKIKSIPCTCDECGAEDECAPGSTCQEPDCDGTMVADKKLKGGAGSGNFGHSGRPGERGGSGEGGGGGKESGGKEKLGKDPFNLQKAGIPSEYHKELTARLHEVVESHIDDMWADGRTGVDRETVLNEVIEIVNENGGAVRAMAGLLKDDLTSEQEEKYTNAMFKASDKLTAVVSANIRQGLKELSDMAHRKKSFSSEIKVVRPAPSVKVLFVPPSSSEIAQRVGDAVEKALSRRTGRIL
jgi:predicted Zn-ribbon and HTH transcriptional regulator